MNKVIVLFGLVIVLYYLCNTKMKQDMEKTMNRTLLNGKKYQFVEWMIFGRPIVSSYCEWDGQYHKIGLDFRTLEEAATWCDEVDYKHTHPVQVKEVPFIVPDDYYGHAGRYYGD